MSSQRNESECPREETADPSSSPVVHSHPLANEMLREDEDPAVSRSLVETAARRQSRSLGGALLGSTALTILGLSFVLPGKLTFFAATGVVGTVLFFLAPVWLAHFTKLQQDRTVGIEARHREEVEQTTA